MATFPPIAENGDPHVEGNNTWIYQDGAWLKQSPQVSTDNVALFDPTNPADSLTAYPQTLPEIPDQMASQYDVNRWFVNALTHLDTQFEDGDFVAGISVSEDPPDDAVNGTLWFDSSEDSLSLFLYYNPNEDGNGIWIPAAPPVSAIEEINQLLGSLDQDVDALQLRVSDLNTVGLEAPINVQDGFIWRNTTDGIDRAYIYEVGRLDGTSGWTLLSPNSRISDTAPVDPEQGDLWFESDTDLALFIYYNDQWIPAAPPSSVEGRVAAGEEAQAEIQQKLGEVVGDLASLENKVNALEGGVFDDTWEFEVDLQTPRQGEFTLLANNVVTTDFAAAQTLVLSTESSSGRPYTFDNVGVNDVIRINSLDGGIDSSVEYKVNQVITPGAFGITYQLGSGVAVDETNYGFTFLPQFDPSGLATIDYVDNQDDLKVNRSGDTIQGTLNISSEGFPNDDGVRLYLRDTAGQVKTTLFPSGTITASNVIRVTKSSGDCFQVRETSGGPVKWKVDADGHTESPRIFLKGGNSANADERVVDVQNGIAGRLAYNNKTRMSWGNNTIWIGTSNALSESPESITLNLQNNKIENVSELKVVHQGTENQKKFSISGEIASGNISNEFFYSYHNPAGTLDAMNYNGKMDNDSNLVNKGYVDSAVGSVSTDTLMPKAGGTFTGLVEFNNGANAQVNFKKNGNNDIQYKGEWIISLQGNENPNVKLAAPINMNGHQITNLSAPTASHHAVTKASVQGIKVVQTSGGSGATESGGFYYSDGRLFYKV